MSMKELKITLDAAGSIFEMFPDSNLTDEIRRLREFSSRINHLNAALVQGQIVALREEHLNQRHALLNADLQALGNDWRNIGSDFLTAYKTTTGKSQIRRKDDAESWSY